MFANLRETRIKNAAAHAMFVVEIFSLKLCVCLAVESDIRNAVPDHIFHPEFLHCGDV